MWNTLDLSCPTEDLCEYFPQDDYLVEELRDFITVLTEAADNLTAENPLWNEMKVLCNIQAKHKRILKCDRCLIHLQRVSHCLKKMILLNLSKAYLDLAERFLIGFQNTPSTLLLPSRQQVEYILIRTMTASKLVCEAVKFTNETFCFLIKKLKVGHLVLDLLMAVSVTARMNLLLKTTLKQLSSMYKRVLSWRYKLKNGIFQWGKRLNLPQDIEEWLNTIECNSLKPLPISEKEIEVLSLLNLKEGNENSQSESMFKDVASVLPSLLNEDRNGDVEIVEEEVIESDSESIICVNEVVKTNESAGPSRMDDTDYGEVVPRMRVELTDEQNVLLQRIINTQSFRDLKKLWLNIRTLPSHHIPEPLTPQKRKEIRKFFLRVKNAVSPKNFNKTFNKTPSSLSTAISIFCKHLGFSEDQLKICKTSASYKEGNMLQHLVPVKTVKQLKILYRQLRELLRSSQNTETLPKLKKMYKCSLCDIKVLKQSGEKATAKKLIMCISKRLIMLCK